jgi:hypothetical protein
VAVGSESRLGREPLVKRRLGKVGSRVGRWSNDGLGRWARGLAAGQTTAWEGGLAGWPPVRGGVVGDSGPLRPLFAQSISPERGREKLLTPESISPRTRPKDCRGRRSRPGRRNRPGSPSKAAVHRALCSIPQPSIHPCLRPQTTARLKRNARAAYRTGPGAAVGQPSRSLNVTSPMLVNRWDCQEVRKRTVYETIWSERGPRSPAPGAGPRRPR